jgi:hypothetical protein
MALVRVLVSSSEARAKKVCTRGELFGRREQRQRGWDMLPVDVCARKESNPPDLGGVSATNAQQVAVCSNVRRPVKAVLQKLTVASSTTTASLPMELGEGEGWSDTRLDRPAPDRHGPLSIRRRLVWAHQGPSLADRFSAFNVGPSTVGIHGDWPMQTSIF